MQTYKLYLIKHAKTAANFEGRYIGTTDEDICEQGAAEILSLMQEYEYPGVGRVYVSPLRRAIQTAGLIYEYHKPVAVPQLAEYNFGEFENKTTKELLQNEHYLNWVENSNEAPPIGGETAAEFKERVETGIKAVVNDMMKSKISQAAVITHGGVIATALSAFGLPRRQFSDWNIENGRGYTLVISPSLWQNSYAAEIFTPLPIGSNQDEIMPDYQKEPEYSLDFLDYEE